MAKLWEPKRRIEKNYAKAIMQLFSQFQRIIASYSDPAKIVLALKDYVASKEFQKAAESIAIKMVTHLFDDGQRNWRAAARVNGMGKEFYLALRQELESQSGGVFYSLVQDNAKLIKTLPLDIGEKITEYIAEASKSGRRSTDIAKEIKEMFPNQTKAKAKLIARTEVSKASTALTHARCERLNIEWYVWRTSDDARVRKSHDHMEGVLINWSNPPSPERLNKERSYGQYHAGNTFNCRCYPEPLIERHHVQWPHKVYHNGAIKMMTLSQFKKIA